jgi:DNA-binding NarL/FixJ family response regulator
VSEQTDEVAVPAANLQVDPIRVLVVDDHALFRRGLQMVLEQEPDIEVVGMGYLLKEISIEEVASAIRAVHGGQSLISPSMASKLLTEFAAMVKKTDDRQQVPTPRLTDREMEVLKLVAKGLNNRDIAKQLFISENTVKNHIRNILEKLQLHSRMEAVVYAVREKLLEIT